ncbi:hypothetical protein [Leucothrix pacifica]|uniref:Roadblock/LAMTOR2 domain-containing protein n=1 Tax=Leucothrix pacifica TaxID=1247513 RepID=A0A317CVF2_9GAMM|nr:hypothetical protein [Leucothrix pacifica]PWR00323.1 hypothetical protein DKW60_01850 [Leucothrix pacifica]
MSDFTSSDDLYMGVTPGGSFYAVQSDADEFGREFLLKLLSVSETPAFNLEIAQDLSGLETETETLEFIHLLQDAGFIYGQKQQEVAPTGSLESMLPEILESLSDDGRAVLAEGQGLYLGSSGFPHEAAEELAALSASLTAIYRRHKDVLRGNLGYTQRAWGLIDAAGNSEIGFWPLYIGGDRFTLIVGGMPQLNQPAFTQLVWALERRYGTHSSMLLN